MKIVAKDKQNMFDIAVIASGAAEQAYVIAYKNNLSPTSQISGLEISIDSVDNKRVVKFFKTQTHQPATSYLLTEGIFDNTFDNTFE